jgi:hypothetical protein
MTRIVVGVGAVVVVAGVLLAWVLTSGGSNSAKPHRACSAAIAAVSSLPPSGGGIGVKESGTNGGGCFEGARGSTAGTTVAQAPASGADGSPAVWVIQDPQSVSAAASEFTAEVSGLECSGGETGTVRQPTIRETASQIVVTFTVEKPNSSGGAATCPGNRPVPTVVRLEAPIGQRALVDGACDPGGAAATTAWCMADFANPVRWAP